MRYAMAVVLCLFLGACAGGPTPQQSAQIKAADEHLLAEARAGRIKWVDYARGSNSAYQTVMAGNPSLKQADVQTAFAYRVALAAEIDAGRLTPEAFDFQWKQYLSNKIAEEDLRRQVAANQMMTTGAALMAAQPIPATPVMCSSMPMGRTVSTTCY